MWKNLKIWMKLTVMGGLLSIGMLVIVILGVHALRQNGQESLDSLEATIREEFDTYSKSQVVNVISMIDTLYAKYQAGEFSLEQMQKLAAGFPIIISRGKERRNLRGNEPPLVSPLCSAWLPLSLLSEWRRTFVP